MDADANANANEQQAFLERANAFVQEYEDNQPLHAFATQIVATLTTNLDKPLEDPDHPFHLYADPDRTASQNLRALRDAVVGAVEDAKTRGFWPAFFFHGGVYYEHLCELHDAFLDLVEEPEEEEEQEQEQEQQA